MMSNLSKTRIYFLDEEHGAHDGPDVLLTKGNIPREALPAGV